jgi:hypothetical protein
MHIQDTKHIAQCCHSLKGLVDRGEAMDQAEFDRFIDRLIWAIHTSPNGSPVGFSEQTFMEQCKGAVV